MIAIHIDLRLADQARALGKLGVSYWRRDELFQVGAEQGGQRDRLADIHRPLERLDLGDRGLVHLVAGRGHVIGDGALRHPGPLAEQPDPLREQRVGVRLGRQRRPPVRPCGVLVVIPHEHELYMRVEVAYRDSLRQHACLSGMQSPNRKEVAVKAKAATRTQAPLYTVPAAAEHLGCSEMHVYRLISAGVLAAVDISTPGSQRSKTRISGAEMDRYIERQTRTA